MEKINPQAAEDFVLTAYKAGVPRDQLENFLKGGYIPLPWQLTFHSIARQCDLSGGPVDVGVGGARGPGKSHGVFAQVSLDDCQRVKGLKGLFLRQTGKSASESFGDLVVKVLAGKVGYEYNRSLNILHFKNGSRLLLGGFENESDIDKYIGIEYDVIAIEERNQLTGEKVIKLKGSLRTSKQGWRPRMYSSFNPGGIGHEDVKREFIIPFRENKEAISRFIPATYKENPYLNPEYVDYLEGLGGELGKRWREGDWDVFAGQYFSEWSNEKHVVEPFKIPESWRKFRSIDPSGRAGTTSCHWYALDNDGTVWVYREHYCTGLDYDEHAKKIAELSLDNDNIQEQYAYTVIDSAAFAKAGYSETAAEVYERHGVSGLIPAAKERVVGWNAVHFYLRHDENILPKLRIFKTCVNMVRTFPLAKHNEKNPEDIDTRGEDHALDECRYLLRTLRESSAPKPMNAIERRLKQLQEEESFNFNYRRN